MTTGHGPNLLDDAPAALLDERALVRQAFALAQHMPGHGDFRPVVLGGPGYPVRIFPGVPSQVHAVRQFVRECLAGHCATTDAVAVASELAANSAVHSASSQPGGQFLVHPVVTGAHRAGLFVTDQGGPFRHRTTPGRHGESGRGLVVVRSLTSLFRICNHDNGLRSFIAVITREA